MSTPAINPFSHNLQLICIVDGLNHFLPSAIHTPRFACMWHSSHAVHSDKLATSTVMWLVKQPTQVKNIWSNNQLCLS